MKEKIVFVSNSGKDSNIGTKEMPVATIQGAYNILTKSNCFEKATVFFREGRYFFNETFRIKGCEMKNVTFKAYENEKVFFDGGIVLNNEEAKKIEDVTVKKRIINSEARENVFFIDLSPYNIELEHMGSRGCGRSIRAAGNEFYVDAEPQNIACYPKDDKEMIPITKVIEDGGAPRLGIPSNGGCKFECVDDRIKYWKDAKDSVAYAFYCFTWADDFIEIEEIDTISKTIKTKYPHGYGFEVKDFTKWRIVNLLEEISQPGEYYIDIKNEKLYFYPSKDIKNSLLQISVLKTPIVSLIETENMAFENIVFENARGTAIYIEGGKGNAAKHCIFRNLGNVGVQIGKGAISEEKAITSEDNETVIVDREKSEVIGIFSAYLYKFAAWDNNGGCNNGISFCEIYNTGTGGAYIGGGERKTLVPANNYIEHTKIYNVNRLEKTYRPGVFLSGVGNRVSHCEMYDMSGSAVILHGNNNLIEYNIIHDVIKEVADAGAIYMGRDLSEVGNKICNNFIYNLSGMKNDDWGFFAIYFDDYCSFNELSGNYFYNLTNPKCTAVLWNKGGQTSVYNNTFIDCASIFPINEDPIDVLYEQLHDENSIIHKRAKADDGDLTGVDIQSEIYKKCYPYLDNLYNGRYIPVASKYCNISETASERIFVNPSYLDFTYKENASMYHRATELVKDNVRGIKSKPYETCASEFAKIGIQKGGNT